MAFTGSASLQYLKFDYDTYLTTVANLLETYGIAITKTILERAIGLKGEALTNVEKSDLDTIVRNNLGGTFDIFVVKLLTFPFQTSDIGLTNELNGCNVLFNTDAT